LSISQFLSCINIDWLKLIYWSIYLLTYSFVWVYFQLFMCWFTDSFIYWILYNSSRSHTHIYIYTWTRIVHHIRSRPFLDRPWLTAAEAASNLLRIAFLSILPVPVWGISLQTLSWAFWSPKIFHPNLAGEVLYIDYARFYVHMISCSFLLFLLLVSSPPLTSSCQDYISAQNKWKKWRS